MPVELDWVIEDNEAPLPDAGPASTRPRGCLRWWRYAALFILAIVLGLGYLALRLHQRQQEISAEVRAAVQLELSALQKGDQDLFLGRQDPADQSWQASQRQAFASYHQAPGLPWETAPPAPRYTGETRSVRVYGDRRDRAQVQVAVESGEHTWWELWFYRWTRAGGWRHVRFDREWLGEEEALVTDHLRFTYPQRDRAIVNNLAREMENWYGFLAPVFGLQPVRRTVLNLEFVYRHPLRSGLREPPWSPDELTVRLPSPHQGLLVDEKNPSLHLRQQMAGYLVEALIAHRAEVHPRERLGTIGSALRQELYHWVLARLADEAFDQQVWSLSTTPVVDHLVTTAGVEILPTLVAGLSRLPRPGSLQQALAEAGIAPVDKLTDASFYLVAALRSLYNSDEQDLYTLLDPEADGNWREYLRNQASSYSYRAQQGSQPESPITLQIRSIVFSSAIAWIETETTWGDGSVRSQTHFLRQEEDRWWLTSPDPAYFGARRETRTEHLVFRFYEREAPWFEERLPAQLQAMIDQMAADLNIPIDGLVFTIETDLLIRTEGEPPPEENVLRVTSPILDGSAREDLDYEVLQMALPLVGQLFERRVPDWGEGNPRVLLVVAAAYLWELDRLFGDQIDIARLWLIGPAAATGPVTSLADVWQTPDSDLEESDFERKIITYHSLVEYLATTYGKQVVPALLDNVTRTEDLDEWLVWSVGVGVVHVEPGWQAWLSERQ